MGNNSEKLTTSMIITCLMSFVFSHKVRRFRYLLKENKKQ